MPDARKALLALLGGDEKMFPQILAEQYPHVLERIVEMWDSTAAIEAYFRDLMLADPRRKQGFPPEVMTEIFMLVKFHDRIYPKQSASALDVWSRSQELAHGHAAQHREEE